jgi:1-acyl-sn-glycerol-3-phosphate acyltransferase
MAERARPGIGRLALESGVPVVPIAVYGSQRARNWKRLQFPKVTIQYGEPIRFERVEHSTHEQQQAVADEILAGVRELYQELERYGRRGMVQRMRRLRRTERHGERAATA